MKKHVEISYLDAVQQVICDLNDSSLGDSFFNAVKILSEILDISNQKLFDILLDKDDKYTLIDKEKAAKFDLVINNYRKKKIPYQYIFKTVEWYGLKLNVNKHVLIPRPETELLTQTIILEETDIENVLDIGTGSGNIAIALSLNIADVEVHAVDISKNALKLAKKNATENGAKVNFYFSDIFSNVKKKFNLIVSNPPYVCAKDLNDPKVYTQIMHEPKEALLPPDYDNKGLYFYREILEKASGFLLPKGVIYLEINSSKVNDIKFIADQNGYVIDKIHKDYQGFDRFIRVRSKNG